ncbi:MAG: ABC transporter ATP-binding protein [Candidatus Heimdallarchaeota archaeon]|nr:ABC transporter ATP-binding protein [Candidatus Heimdallarchaeota archaeon]
MKHIELREVTVRKDGKLLLDKVSISIDYGEYIGLLGPTGSGPSYILQVIAGLLKVDNGQVFMDGVDVTDSPPEDRHVGFIFEQFNLFPHLDVLGNLLFGPRMRRENIENKTRIAREIISLVRLNGREHAYPKELSGGMQQRVGIARAVTAGAKIMLLDQPYRALDAKIREEMRFEIREIVKDLNLTAIHATHETEEAMIISDRIAIFNEGKLEQIGSPEEVFRSPINLFVATFLAESNVWDGRVKDNQAVIKEIEFETSNNEDSEGKIVIRQEACDLYHKEPTGKNVYSVRVIKIRILGEFIRFNVIVNEKLDLVCRERLDMKWENPAKYIDQKLFLKIQPNEIQFYPSSNN